MKLLWVLPCLAVCACAAKNDAEAYYDEQIPVQTQQQVYAGENTVAMPQQQTAQNPYALKPAVYEDNNFALSQKENELFQKEKNLIAAQQELYERERKLANREAEFINRSKALDYKEKSIQDGRLYAPVSAAAPQQPAMMVPAGQPYAPVPQNPAPAQPAPVVPQPITAPAPIQAPEQNVPFAPYALQEDEFSVQNTTVYNSTSEPVSFEPAQPGFIIMQHPIQRDLVRCPASDDVCLQSYERLGYVRSANLSRFTAQDELNTAGTYPTNTSGKWRENNSIPRW